jgi:hypothetical protein
VVEFTEIGLVGGYLVLNAAGRPLEFHCTAPVKPTRAQQILYGPTLAPYLYGEQIGQALLAKSKLTPLAVCTDAAAVLAARDFTPHCMALVLSPDGAEPPAACGRPFTVGKNRLATAVHYTGDQQQILAAWPHEADGLDLAEPFARIREALDEAQRGARQAA